MFAGGFGREREKRERDACTCDHGKSRQHQLDENGQMNGTEPKDRNGMRLYGTSLHI